MRGGCVPAGTPAAARPPAMPFREAAPPPVPAPPAARRRPAGRRLRRVRSADPSPERGAAAAGPAGRLRHAVSSADGEYPEDLHGLDGSFSARTPGRRPARSPPSPVRPALVTSRSADLGSIAAAFAADGADAGLLPGGAAPASDDLESSAPTLGAARPAARGARGRRVRFSDETGEVAEARRRAGPVSHPLL
jgi:hypothetical protein